jgi:hypothetical protein
MGALSALVSVAMKKRETSISKEKAIILFLE